jgi:hypothetical protein
MSAGAIAFAVIRSANRYVQEAQLRTSARG